MTHPIDQLLVEAAQLADWLYVESVEDGAAWYVQLDESETEAVSVDFDPLREVLVLSAELGSPPSGDRRAELLELFLRYNDQWRLTGGLRVSLLATSPDAFILSRDIAAGTLDASGLTGHVSEFAEKTRAWRELVATPRKAEEQQSAEQWLMSAPGSLRA